MASDPRLRPYHSALQSGFGRLHQWCLGGVGWGHTSCGKQCAQTVRLAILLYKHSFLILVGKSKLIRSLVNIILDQAATWIVTNSVRVVAVVELKKQTGRSWGILGRSWVLLPTAWVLLGGSWGFLGSSWELLVEICTLAGRSWRLLGVSWELFVGICTLAGSYWGLLVEICTLAGTLSGGWGAQSKK